MVVFLSESKHHSGLSKCQQSNLLPVVQFHRSFWLADIGTYCCVAQGWTSYISANLVLVSAVYCRACETFFLVRLQNGEKRLYVMSVCLFAWDNSATTEWVFMKFDIWRFFSNLYRKIELIWMNNEWKMNTNIHFWSYLTEFFLEWGMFQTKFVDKIKTHFVFTSFFFFRKSCRLWDNVGKYCTAGQATW